MKIRAILGDITKVESDFIVNAANSSLLGGGGVDGAIHRKGGPQILEDCRSIRARQGKCSPGEAVITRAGNLPAKHIIHTVGPVWNGGEKNEDQLLAHCYENSLALCEQNGGGVIAFPGISTGIYRFPKERAAKIAIEVVRTFKGIGIEEVIFVCFDEASLAIYDKIL